MRRKQGPSDCRARMRSQILGRRRFRLSFPKRRTSQSACRQRRTSASSGARRTDMALSLPTNTRPRKQGRARRWQDSPCRKMTRRKTRRQRLLCACSPQRSKRQHPESAMVRRRLLLLSATYSKPPLIPRPLGWLNDADVPTPLPKKPAVETVPARVPVNCVATSMVLIRCTPLASETYRTPLAKVM